MTLTEHAPAKVNLTLKVIGKRSDGFHELVSLVAFASVGDALELVPAGEASLGVTGPFASELGGDNLVLQAAKILLEHVPDRQTGAFTLDKRLPVAAGLGGGSADAAAALRLMERATPDAIPRETFARVAGKLGADVPVCLASKASMMRGRGDDITQVAALPVLPSVLVNPGVALGTADVFSALGAAPVGEGYTRDGVGAESFSSADDLVAYIQNTGNDLEGAATKCAPVIAQVRAALHETAGCRMAQMSGSGATCFGIFGDMDQAGGAAQAISAAHPHWWVVATELG